MSYRIRIVHIQPMARLEWKQVADSGNPRDGGAQYDYVPSEGTKEVSIYEQEVDDLDLAAVIRAVNRMGGAA